MSTLKVERAGNQVILSGFLDENAELSRLEGLTGKVIFNMKGITRVNSCGVRDWVNLTKKIAGTEIQYLECPMVVVKQFNAVPAFLGNAQVGSFFGPYFCESCDKEELKLLQASSVKDAKAPAAKCETCGNPLGFDAIPNQYFSFLQRAKSV